MPSLNRSLLRRDGYLILRNVIPADRLDDVRTVCEAILDRQREIWRREAGPGDPPGGVWDSRPQPRVPEFERLVDAETALAVELWLSEPIMGVSREVLSGTEAVPMHMMMMCNPRTDHGPAKWHRDIGQLEVAPLWLLQEELAETGPRYLQWNLPLYDDDVLWVVPGSHRRLNTPEEDRQLAEDPRSPLPGGMRVELKAGDGLIYYHSMLHWGSNYSPKLRRTVHGGIAVHAMPAGYRLHPPPLPVGRRRVPGLEPPRGGAAGPHRAGAARRPGRRRGGLSHGTRALAPRRRTRRQAGSHGLPGRSRAAHSFAQAAGLRRPAGGRAAPGHTPPPAHAGLGTGLRRPVQRDRGRRIVAPFRLAGPTPPRRPPATRDAGSVRRELGRLDPRRFRAP